MVTWLIWLGPVACLLIALFEMPYGYYQLLRVLIFCASCYIGVSEIDREPRFWLWAFSAIALIYNPVFKLSLGREIWFLANIATIALFLIHFWWRWRLATSKAGASA